MLLELSLKLLDSKYRKEEKLLISLYEVFSHESANEQKNKELEIEIKKRGS